MDEERREKSRDHDVLTRIDVNLSNFMRRYEEHVKENETDFNEVKGRLSRAEKFIYMALGALALFEILMRIFHHG